MSPNIGSCSCHTGDRHSKQASLPRLEPPSHNRQQPAKEDGTKSQKCSNWLAARQPLQPTSWSTCPLATIHHVFWLLSYQFNFKIIETDNMCKWGSILCKWVCNQLPTIAPSMRLLKQWLVPCHTELAQAKCLLGSHQPTKSNQLRCGRAIW